MLRLRILFICLLVTAPLAALADLRSGELPAARWYVHIDLEAMRASDAGRHLYAWLDDEVFSELREETGFDADKEAHVVTALASPDGGVLVVVDGTFSQMTQDRIVALGAAASEFNELKYAGKTYFRVNDDDEHSDPDHDQRDAPFDDGAFISVGLGNKLLVTSSEQQMHALLDGNGSIPGNYDTDGTLIVLSAENSLVQAGMSINSFSEDLGWDSNMLRNTRQLAVLVADQAGKIAVEAQLVANEAEMANSLASILRGLISLQVFNDDLDPEFSEFLRSTTVTVEGATLSVRLAIDPEALVEALD